MAFDADAGKIWFAENNVWANSGDPAAGTGEQYSGITGTQFPAAAGILSNGTSVLVTANFGATTLTYTAPSGFSSGIFTTSRST